MRRGLVGASMGSRSRGYEGPVFPDLAGYEWGMDASGTLFQEEDGTVAVTANGDAVGYAPDLSGNGRHAVQATSGSRPEYVRTGGRGSLLFRSSAKTLVTSSFLGSSFDTSWTQYWVIETGTTNVFSLPNGFNGLAMYIAPRPTAGATAVRVNTQNLTVTATDLAYTDGNVLIVAARYNGSTKKVMIRSAADAYTSSEAATGNLGFSGTVTVGDLSSGGFPFVGRLYATHLYSAVHSDDDMTAMLNYLAARYLVDPPAGASASGISDRLVVCHGNSLTENTGPTKYSAQLEVLLGAGWTVETVASSGATTPQLSLSAELDVDSLFDSDKIDCWCVCWEVTNDLYFGAPAAVAQRRFRDLCLRRRAAGWKVVVIPVLSRSGWSTPASFNTSRGTINTWINDVNNVGVLWDAVASLPSAMTIDGAETDLTYFAGDNTHLNETGYGEVAQAVYDIIAPQA